MSELIIRATNEDDRPFMREFIARRWFGEAVIIHGQFYYPAELPGFIAQQDHLASGLITYQIRKSECEIITLDSLVQGMGIGSHLIQKVKHTAIETGCNRLTVITTNDNLEAIGFYQKRGFRIREISTGAVEKARELKPTIPMTGNNNIPIRDEILLEMSLAE
jgi:ribosomal protein S18 acetylase RimI-like enzyme